MCCRAVHIYLCDDAPPDHKEEYKGTKLSVAALRQELVDKLYDTHDIPVIRVTRKKEKSANPKSDNLNNCLKQIYGEGQVPPESEVIAVFDADQAAHSHFFTATLPWMDSGDDVGLVQSPQVRLPAWLPIIIALHTVSTGTWLDPSASCEGYIECILCPWSLYMCSLQSSQVWGIACPAKAAAGMHSCF